MSDQINNQAANAGDNSNSGNILKELSDIKYSLGINTNETSNIRQSLQEVSGVVKEMQKNYITQEQHKQLINAVADHETRIRNKVDKTDYDEFRGSTSKDILVLKESRGSQNVLISIGIGLITLLTAILVYSLFKIKI